MCGSRVWVEVRGAVCQQQDVRASTWIRGHPADLAGVIAHTLLVTLQTPLHYHSALSKLLLLLQFLCPDC